MYTGRLMCNKRYSTRRQCRCGRRTVDGGQLLGVQGGSGGGGRGELGRLWSVWQWLDASIEVSFGFDFLDFCVGCKFDAGTVQLLSPQKSGRRSDGQLAVH